MKNFRVIILLVVLLSLLIPSPVNAASAKDDRVVMGGSFILERDQTLNGNLIVIGGTAKIEKDAVVNGSIMLVGGQVTVDEIVEGSITLFGASASIHDSAIILGDIYVTSSVLNRSDLADIRGEVIEGKPLPPGFSIPDQVTPPDPITTGPMGKVATLLGSLLSIFFFSLVSASIAIIASLFMPGAIQRVSDAMLSSPVIGFGTSILTLIALPFILVILIITIILSPLAILLVVALALACYMGWVSIGTELGKRIAGLFKTVWPVPISAGMGTLILSLVLGVVSYVPCLGWGIVSIVVLIGLGGVLLSRFGTRTYTSTLFNSKTTDEPAPVGPSDPTNPAI